MIRQFTLTTTVYQLQQRQSARNYPGYNDIVIRDMNSGMTLNAKKYINDKHQNRENQLLIQ